MSAILTIVVIKFLNVIYDKQIRANLECHYFKLDITGPRKDNYIPTYNQG